MVETISKEDLQKMSKKELLRHIKALEDSGYPIELKQVAVEALLEDDVEKFLRKKIRHAQRSKMVEEKEEEPDFLDV